MRGRRHSLKWARPCLITLTLLFTPRWRGLPLLMLRRLKRNRSSRPLPARTILPSHIPARWWILPPPVTRRPRRRKRRSSRSLPRKRTSPPNPAEADYPRMARSLPIRQSSPNLSMGDFLLLMLLILSNHIYSLSLAIAASIQDILPVYFAQFPVSF